MLQTASFANPQHKIRAKIEQLIGTADTDAFYEAWLANHVRKADIDSLAAWGFNSVRLPMHYNLYTLPIEDEPVAGQQTWLTKGFELTDSVISWCRQNQLYVILDLHAAPGGQGQDAGISDYDETKPSLWQSTENRNKTVALWKKLAERYANEPWIAGYDLINEPNWSLPGNALLRALYEEVTDSIRTVDTTHIIFIEGNWWANDFNGLTPPWDSKLVYSPHKYWSVNDQASIQWVLDLRENHQVPLYLGESGENSNVWFRDAITLLEDFGIGWAWWPMKKVEAIAGPLSVPKKSGYQTLLNYWENGGAAPSATFAKNALMELAEDLKIENCIYQKDVIDAMIRQVAKDEKKAFKTHSVPGIIYAPDYDLGPLGTAYFDHQAATYHVTTGNYTSWNNGWAYRNDGVDIEKSSDVVNSNGYNVGWIDENEWMKYQMEVTESGVYDINVRIATAGFSGRFYLQSGNSDLTNLRYVPNTGDYQTWQTLTIPNVILTPEDTELGFYSVGSDYNLGSFEFIKTGPTNSLDTEILNAHTLDASSIQLNLNKPMFPTGASANDFQIFVNGQPISISQVEADSINRKILRFSVNHNLVSSEQIRITYSGTLFQAFDSTFLQPFTLEEVENRLPTIYQVPGKIEAEGYFFHSGVKQENTLDTGGGKNVGHLDAGDYMDYVIQVNSAGTYEASFRTAAASETGAVTLQLIDEQGKATFLQDLSFAPTGDWQSWATTTASVSLPAGRHHLRVLIKQSQFNLNWFEFTGATSLEDLSIQQFRLYPNPGSGQVSLEADWQRPQQAQVRAFSIEGAEMWQQQFPAAQALSTVLNLDSLSPGIYLIQLQLEDGSQISQKWIKTQ